MDNEKYKVLKQMLSPFVAMIINLFMVFVVYFIARTEFLLENFSYFSEHLTWSNFATMYWGESFET